MSVPRLDVAVAGGSLGGLTAALLLRDAGHDVTVYERSEVELRQRGAGIGFLPDSYRYLVERVGLHLDDISTSTEVIRYLSRGGEVTYERRHRYHFSSWNAVYRNLVEAFGTERYLLGHEVTEAVAREDHVEVSIAGDSRHHADLLVAADGVGSAFRDRLQPQSSRQYSGYVAWRGMALESALPRHVSSSLCEAISYYVYANSHILVYPIPGPDGSVAPGERLINFVWYRNYLEGDDLDDVLLDEDGVQRSISVPPGCARADHIAEVRATAAARLPASLSAVVLATVDPFLQVVYDVDIDQMAFGRTVLLGDAGFVARPHAAAGTAKAAANAWALVEALQRHDRLDTALDAWNRDQVALGRQLLDRTRRIGMRSQVTNDWNAADADLLFRLREEGP